MATDDKQPASDLDQKEIDAIHEVELGVEWLTRAHGALLEFHHGTGHAMEHLAAAESLFRERGHEALADDIKHRFLPRGVIDQDRWSYDVLETFEDGMLADVDAFEERARREVTGGRRHVAEQQQERDWKDRAKRE